MKWCRARKDFLRGRMGENLDFEYLHRTGNMRILMMALKLGNDSLAQKFLLKNILFVTYTRDLDYLI